LWKNPVKPQTHKTRANQGLSIAKEFHPNSYNESAKKIKSAPANHRGNLIYKQEILRRSTKLSVFL
jgi:hypothetical protein